MPIYMKKHLIVLFGLLTIIAQSQTYECQVFNNKNGLLDNEVYDVFVDSKGFLWASTQRGIHVYDGKTIKLFADKVGSPREQKDGSIYALGINIIKRYNPLKLIETINVKGLEAEFYDKKINATMRAWQYLDKEGILYSFFGYNKSKQDTLSIFVNGKPKYISFVNERKNGFDPRIFLDNHQTMWVFFENKKTGEKKLNYFEKGNLIPVSQKINSTETIECLFTTKKNEQYVYCKSAIYKISKNNVSKITIPKEVGSYFFQYHHNKCEDSKGNVWMPYEKGLFKISDVTTELIVDNGPREIMCDSIIESSFDEKGNETITKNWMCDSRVFISAIGIDSKDRILTGNKIYEKGKFTEVFKANSEVSINKMLFDNEDNIWYATSVGLIRYRSLPVKNITTTEKLRGDFTQIDNDENIYTQTRHGKGWTNISKFLVYKHDIENDRYLLKDSLFIRDEGVFNPLTELSVRFTEIIPMKAGVLILTEDLAYFYDGKSLKRQDINKLKLSEDKIIDQFTKNKKIRKSTLFKDFNGFVWFYYDGNYIKTNGIDFWCFGKEAGIKDTLKMTDGNFRGSESLEPSNFIISEKEFYILRKDKFIPIKFAENGLKVNGQSAHIFGEKETPYFLFDSIDTEDKKINLLRFENNRFTKYSVENPDNLRIITRGIFPFKNNYFVNLKDDGFAKLEIDDKAKKAAFKRIPVSSQHISDHARYCIMHNKLFQFTPFGSMTVFSLDSVTMELSEPLILPEYSVFYFSPIIRGNKFFINNSGALGEHEQWFLKWDSKGRYFNTTEPQLNFISLSYENKDQQTELFSDFNGIEIPYNFNPFKINFKGICLTDGSKVKYKYFLEGLDDKWNEITEDNVTYSSLSPGTYKFKVLACNNHGVWTETPIEFSFTVLPPWNRTWWAYSMYVIAGFAAIRGYLKNRTKKLEKEKEKLEKTVKERTEEVMLQKHLLEEKNKEMIDSITYAKRIQSSLMPTEKYISRILGKKK